jgi:hypothetical protein
MLVDFIDKMHEKVVYRKTKEELYLEQKEEEEKKKKEEEEKDELQKEVAVLETEVDEFTRSLYEDVITLNRQDTGSNLGTQIKNKNYYRAKRQTLYDTIKVSFVRI